MELTIAELRKFIRKFMEETFDAPNIRVLRDTHGTEIKAEEGSKILMAAYGYYSAQAREAYERRLEWLQQAARAEGLTLEPIGEVLTSMKRKGRVVEGCIAGQQIKVKRM